MPVVWTWAGITARFHLLHIPSTDPAALLATPALAPFALLGGGVEMIPAVSARLASVSDGKLLGSLILLAQRLVPDLTDIIMEQLRGDNVSTEIIVEKLMNTEVGQTIVKQGIEQGIEQGAAAQRIDDVRNVLQHRFPGADEDGILRTAQRLTATAPTTALDAAFALDTLDA